MKKWIKKLNPKAKEIVCATIFFGEVLLGLIGIAELWLLWALLY